MRLARWSLRTQVTALCLAVAVALGVIATGAAVTAVRSRSQLVTVFNQIAPARADSERLLATVYEQSSGINGYATTGDPGDLSAYRSGTDSERSVESELTRLVGARDGLGGRIAQASAQIAAWRATVADPAADRVRAGDRAGAQALLASGRPRFGTALAGVNDLRGAIFALREATVSDARHGIDQIVRLLIAAGLVVAAAAILLAMLLRLLVIRPMERLVDHVQAVAAGDYGHRIGDGASPELARLSRGIEAMRQRIVAELAEVSTARAALESANQQLEQQATELTRSNRDLEQFAYVASHDLQEPLRKVASFCQLLQRRYAGQLDERADQYIHFAVDGAQRMQRLINDLLAFSRIGRRTSGFTDVDLNAVVAEIVDQFDATIARSGAEVTWDELPVVRGEEALLTALLANLISNSIKFRRPDLPPRIHVSARQVGEEWEIGCQDNGIGIEAEFADKVFVIFQRLHPKEAYPGTGIGLAVAKKIVEYHGGRIWLDSSPGGGSLIRFTLPIPEPAALPEAPADGAQPEGEPPAAAPAGDAATGDGAGQPGRTPEDTDENLAKESV